MEQTSKPITAHTEKLSGQKEQRELGGVLNVLQNRHKKEHT